MSRTSRIAALLTLIVLVGLLVVANREYLFHAPHHESGDLAVNALQIDRAKHFVEIYGNYSRFHFYHPGPAFFYVYAVGEIFFHDWLKITAAPHGAHVLAGLILQAAFFAAAVGIAASHFRSRLFVPLALLFAAVNWTLARNAFTSIWPPHVLLMPFLCFLVACASLAVGRVSHLPIAALAGCFLVHGHVAQGAFVGPLFVLAYWLFLSRTRQNGETWWGPIRRHYGPHLLGAVFIALFSIPLLIDLTRLDESNIAAVFRYLRGGNEPLKPLSHALAYVASFFVYFHDQDAFLPDSGLVAHPTFIFARASWFLAWVPILAGVIFTLRSPSERARLLDTTGFYPSLALFAATTLFLCVFWAMMQSGSMFEFNSYFAYTLNYTLLLLLAATLAGRLRTRRLPLTGTAMCLGGAIIIWHGTELSLQTNPNALALATQAALKADPQSDKRKLLVFDHEDWPDIAGVALALKRAGCSYRVNGNWSSMFGEHRTFMPEGPSFDLGEFAIWRFSRADQSGAKAKITDRLVVYFESPSLDPASLVLDCTARGNLRPFILFGFTEPDGRSVWTTLPIAVLHFRSAQAKHDVVFRIEAEPFLMPDRIESQPMTLYVNRERIGSFDLRELQKLTIRIPAEIWNRDTEVTMTMHFPNAQSPMQLGVSRDPRMFGWIIHRMALEARPQLSTDVTR